jgi:hypothetical protein
MNPSNPFIWEFSQFWLPEPEPAFAPGRVSIGRDNTDLLVRADLHDAHVMRDEYPFNFPAFTKCDAFEIFLGPADEAAYYELHVTPANGVLQLFFEGTGEKKSLEERAVAEPAAIVADADRVGLDWREERPLRERVLMRRGP